MLVEKSMPFMALHRAVALLVLFVAACTPVLTEQLPCVTSPAPKGAWAQEGGGVRVRFEAERVVVLRSEGDLRAATILSREPCKLVVRDEGLRSTWSLTGGEQSLRLDLGKGPALTLVPLSNEPSSLDINPLSLPPAGPVPPEKVNEVARELTAREQRDQEMATATKPGEKSKRPAALAENLRQGGSHAARFSTSDWNPLPPDLRLRECRGMPGGFAIRSFWCLAGTRHLTDPRYRRVTGYLVRS